jgi:hypothetical protein
MAGRPGKYETHVKPKLLLIEAWARDGLILDDIANNLNIAKSTLCEYQNQYTELSDSLKRGKDEVDIIVENSLFKRALGYDFEEITQEPLFNAVTGEPILDSNGEQKIAVTKIVRKQVVPDTTAQIFWLKNRKSKEWRDRHEVEHSGNMVIFNGESELTD